MLRTSQYVALLLTPRPVVAKVRSMIQAASGSGSMGKPDYPRWLTLDSLKSMIEKGYKEYMWGHFQSRFFFPPDYVKARPDVLETLFKKFLGPSPAIGRLPAPRDCAQPARDRRFAAQNRHADPRVSRRRGQSSFRYGQSLRQLGTLARQYPRGRIRGGAGLRSRLFLAEPEEVNKIIRDWLDRH